MTDLVYRVFVEPFTNIAMQQALIGATMVAIVSSVVGCFVVLRRTVFLGDALSHAMLAGVVGGFLFMQILFGKGDHPPALIIGSIIASIVTVGMIHFVSKLSRIKEDTSIGILYTGIFALGGAAATMFRDIIHIDIFHFIMGYVLSISPQDLWFSGIVTALVLSTVILMFRYLKLTTFDPIMAAAIGIPVTLVDYVLLVSTSLVVVSAVTMVGVVLVVGLLVTPAATAYLLCDRLSRMLWTAAVFGVTGVVGGLYLTSWVGNVSGSAFIILFTTFQFFVVLVVAPRYGLAAAWIRRRRTVPQPLVEDVLRCIQKGEASVPLATIVRHCSERPRVIIRAIDLMQRSGLVQRDGDAVALTEAGRLEARKILRAHRLWETYLKHVGLPDSQLHEQAHRLEHVHDEDTVDYLEDKLGHPLTDPHGSAIPEDFVHLVAGNRVSASLLREGHRATIVRVGNDVSDERLKEGQAIEMGAREDGGRVWAIRLPDGSSVRLEHKAADAVIVELS